MSRRKSFWQQLHDLAEEEELVFVVPYPFLPPRYLKNSKRRNLLLRVSLDLEISTSWEGARISEPDPLTPGKARQLINEVLGRMNTYAEDGFDLAVFISEYGCISESDLSLDDPSSRREDRPPALKNPQQGSLGGNRVRKYEGPRAGR